MTTKRPWMPLYIADYLADTAHLRAAQSGAYLHLIMHYWQNGGLPADDFQLSTIARMTPAEWRRDKPLIKAFFYDGWKHKRVEAELRRTAKEAKAFSARARAAARKRWMPQACPEQCLEHATSMPGAMLEECLGDATSHFTLHSKKDPSQGKVTSLRPELVEGGGPRPLRNGGAS